MLSRHEAQYITGTRPGLAQNPPVAAVAALGDGAAGDGGLNGAAGLVQVGAVGEAAPPGGLAHFAEALDELGRLDCAEAEFRYARAIYKEAVRQAIQARRGCRLAPEAVPRDVPDDGIPAQSTEDAALPDTAHAAEQGMAGFQRGPKVFDVLAGLRVEDDDVVSQATVQSRNLLGRRSIREVRLREDDDRSQSFELGEREQLIEREQARRRIGKRGDRCKRIDVGGHRFCPALDGAAFQREGSIVHAIDERAPVLEDARIDSVAGSEHLALPGGALQIGDARLVFGVQDDPCGIFTDGNNSSREGLVHAANEVRIVKWARTLRVDAPPEEAERSRIAAALAREGVRVTFGGSQPLRRLYALVEGAAGVDPAELECRVPDARWYGDAIIALAIEPEPADALQALLQALGGPGAPSGVVSCERFGDTLIVEFSPGVTPARLIARIADVEIRRFEGHRRIELLTPLPLSVLAAIAADGLQAAEIAPDRVLEHLLESAHVE